jgi:hypothetical protein
MSKIEVNQVSSQCGSTLTIGQSGDTVQLASGASQTGFGRTGTVNWDTTAKTAAFTAVSGNGYFVDTTSAAITVTLPASPSAGDIVAVADYAGTSNTNKITIARNSSKIEGGTDDASIDAVRESKTLIYVDATQGWVPVNSNDTSSLEAKFVAATGGTVTTSGNFKIHTFTSPGTLCVSCAGNACGSNTVDYLIVAGGGGGGGISRGGGGGAGGYRESSGAASGCYTVSPLGTASALPVSVQAYPITVGGGGAGQAAPDGNGSASQGGNSIFSTITSAGGGGGRDDDSPKPANPATNGGSGGGSGGGANPVNIGGSGNTPPVDPPQGKDGGTANTPDGDGNQGGGGGGATEAGFSNLPAPTGGHGGDGATSEINGTSTTRAGGGGASATTGRSAGPGGSGGGGAGGPTGGAGTAGTTNTGGGAGGGGSGAGATGGSGIVIIRYKFQ